jgi:triosephosphate isomerase
MAEIYQDKKTMKYIIANLKMNILSPQERERYLNAMEKELKKKKLKNIEIILCPAFVHLEAFNKWKGKRRDVKIGAQNMFSEDKGSYTGEVSPVMLKKIGVDFVILGHSERRRYFMENNEEVNLKIIAALKNGIRPILCIGETKTEKENDLTMQVVEKQLEECLMDIPRAKIEQIIFVYEPVWAISSNNPDCPPITNEIMSARLLIRKFLVEKYGTKIAGRVAIIYGGSVNMSNVKDVCINSEMDGTLVGKESLLPHEFIKIANELTD